MYETPFISFKTPDQWYVYLQDGQPPLRQHAAAQAGPAEEAHRGEAEAEESPAEQEDRSVQLGTRGQIVNN